MLTAVDPLGARLVAASAAASSDLTLHQEPGSPNSELSLALSWLATQAGRKFSVAYT